MIKIYYMLLIIILSVASLYSQNIQKGKLHGYMYGDYFYNISRDINSSKLKNAVFNGEKDFNGFQFRKVYLAYDHFISNRFTTRLRLEANSKDVNNNGKLGVFVKDAYIKWKNIFNGSDLIFGISSPPALSVTEDNWGYKSLILTLMDLRDIVPSRDFGIALKGRLNKSGSVKYWVMAANGEGIRPERNNQKRFYGHIDIEPIKNFRLTLYGDLDLKDDINDPISGKNVNQNITTTSLFFGYKLPGKYSIGIEGFYQFMNNELETTKGLTERNRSGYSIFGSYELDEKFSVVSKYDYFDPTSNKGYSGDVRNLFMFAVNYRADTYVWIMPNIVLESYENLSNVTSSVTGRLTLFYKFL